MARKRDIFISASTSVVLALMVTVSTVAAHEGEEHGAATTSFPYTTGLLAVGGVIVIAGLAYWLFNRRSEGS